MADIRAKADQLLSQARSAASDLAGKARQNPIMTISGIYLFVLFVLTCVVLYNNDRVEKLMKEKKDASENFAHSRRASIGIAVMALIAVVAVIVLKRRGFACTLGSELESLLAKRV